MDRKCCTGLSPRRISQFSIRCTLRRCQLNSSETHADLRQSLSVVKGCCTMQSKWNLYWTRWLLKGHVTLFIVKFLYFSFVCLLIGVKRAAVKIQLWKYEHKRAEVATFYLDLSSALLTFTRLSLTKVYIKNKVHNLSWICWYFLLRTVIPSINF